MDKAAFNHFITMLSASLSHCRVSVSPLKFINILWKSSWTLCEDPILHHNFNLFVGVRTHNFLVYPVGCNPLLLLVWVLKMSKTGHGGHSLKLASVSFGCVLSFTSTSYSMTHRNVLGSSPASNLVAAHFLQLKFTSFAPCFLFISPVLRSFVSLFLLSFVLSIFS